MEPERSHLIGGNANHARNELPPVRQLAVVDLAHNPDRSAVFQSGLQDCRDLGLQCVHVELGDAMLCLDLHRFAWRAEGEDVDVVHDQQVGGLPGSEDAPVVELGLVPLPILEHGLKELGQRRVPTDPHPNRKFGPDAESGVIVGVEATNAGTDAEELPPMLDQLNERYDRMSPEALVDGGFATVDTIDQAAERGVTVYAPIKDEEKQRAAGKDPHAPKKGDSEPFAQWRSRMGTEDAKLIYRLRCQTAEWVNAQCRNRGFWHTPVRGQPRCRIVALLFAIAHNLVVAERLRPVMA